MSLNENNELQRQSSLNAMKRIECSYNLIVELKRLFAFMTKSEKKYTDPTAMIRNIVDDFGNQLKIGDQQDISEVSEGFMSRIHEGIQAIEQPFPQAQDSIPFQEEDKFGEGDEEDSNEQNSSDSSESETEDIFKRVEKYTIKNESEGYIKDMYYGKQVETTECVEEKGHESIDETEFLLILLNIEVSYNLTFCLIST